MDSTVLTTSAANPPDTEAIAQAKASAHALLEQAKGLVVENATDCEIGGKIIARCASAGRTLEGLLRPNIKRLHAAKTAALDELKTMTVPLAEARAIADRKTSDWRQRQRQIEVAEAAALQEKLTKDAEDRQLDHAEHLENLGKLDERDALLKRPVTVPTVVRQTEIPKIPGQHPVVTWRARVTDASLVDDKYKVIDMGLLNDLARSLKDKAVCPGVEFYSNETTAQRSV